MPVAPTAGVGCAALLRSHARFTPAVSAGLDTVLGLIVDSTDSTESHRPKWVTTWRADQNIHSRVLRALGLLMIEQHHILQAIISRIAALQANTA